MRHISWFDFLLIANLAPPVENQNAVFYRNSEPWNCEPWKCWESKCSFLEKFWPVKLPLSLFLALAGWHLPPHLLSAHINVGIVMCLNNIFPLWGESEFLTKAGMIDFPVPGLHYFDMRWLPGSVSGPGCASLGHGRSRSLQLCSDWWPRLFNVPQRGDCLKGVLSHKFLPASKTLHKAGTIRWNCISNFLPSS